MRHDRSVKTLVYADRNLLSILCCLLIIIVMWLGVYLDNSSTVLAESIEKRIAVEFNGAIASKPTVMNDLRNQVKDDLNEKSRFTIDDPSLVDTVVEKARSGTRLVKRSFDDSAKQVEITGGAMNRQKSENVAKIQSKAVNSEHEADNAVERVMGNIRARIK